VGINFLKTASRLFGQAKSVLSDYGQRGIDAFESGEIKQIATFSLVETPAIAIGVGAIACAGLACLGCSFVRNAVTGFRSKPAKTTPSKQPVARQVQTNSAKTSSKA
jgi:hypothetical protein